MSCRKLLQGRALRHPRGGFPVHRNRLVAALLPSVYVPQYRKHQFGTNHRTGWRAGVVPDSLMTFPVSCAHHV
jgi:hypothetical protein